MLTDEHTREMELQYSSLILYLSPWIGSVPVQQPRFQADLVGCHSLIHCIYYTKL